MEALLIYTGKVALLLAAALLPFCVVTLHRTVEVPDGSLIFGWPSKKTAENLDGRRTVAGGVISGGETFRQGRMGSF